MLADQLHTLAAKLRENQTHLRMGNLVVPAYGLADELDEIAVAVRRYERFADEAVADGLSMEQAQMESSNVVPFKRP